MSILSPKGGWRSTFLVEWPTILIAMVLTGIGFGLIFSATAPMGDAGRSYVMKQVTWFTLGMACMAMFLLFDYHTLDRWAIWIYLFVVAALIAVWAVGKVTGGSRRWIDMGLMRVQPSEFAKLAVVIILAKIFQRRPGKEGLSLLELVRPALLVAVPVLLVLIQPDLGTAGVISLIAVSMILFTGVSSRALLWIGGFIAAAAPLLYFMRNRLFMEYQLKRLTTFISPESEPLGSGYHIIQSQIAIGSGGLWGKGFLQGAQNQLMFLPVKHTDFIFPVLAEEWGFVGSTAVLLIFVALFFRGLTVAGKARDDFGALLAFGCVAVLFWHVIINVGMVMGLVPVVGVPLSFLSYGGSSLLSSYLVIAILVNVSARRFVY
jgi:rod shape determining protein RodA